MDRKILMTGDRENDRDNRKIVGLGCPGKHNYITTNVTLGQPLLSRGRYFGNSTVQIKQGLGWRNLNSVLNFLYATFIKFG